MFNLPAGTCAVWYCCINITSGVACIIIACFSAAYMSLCINTVPTWRAICGDAGRWGTCISLGINILGIGWISRNGIFFVIFLQATRKLMAMIDKNKFFISYIIMMVSVIKCFNYSKLYITHQYVYEWDHNTLFGVDYYGSPQK